MVSQKDITNALKPYKDLGAWIASPYCFLTDNERRILAYSYTYRTNSLSALELGVHQDVVEQILVHVLYKLVENQVFYQQFEKRVTGSTPALRQAQFLQLPLEKALPRQLYLKLFFCGANMAQLLANYSKEELIAVKNFGPVSLEQLNDLLEENYCTPLLRNSINQQRYP